MTHGTSYAYKKGCRCEECRGSRRAYGELWRRANPEYKKNWLEAHPGYRPSRASLERAQAKWMQAERWYYKNIRILKAAQGCCLCGQKEGVLIHHHVDPETKRYAVTQMNGCRLESIIDEIAKCVVLCNSCHSRWHLEMRLIQWQE